MCLDLQNYLQMTMQNFDINKVLDNAGIPLDRIARELYPANKYPLKALERVMEGRGKLDTDQIAKLAKLLNTTIADLFKGCVTAVSRDGVHTITLDDYTAEVDTVLWKTRVYHKGTLIHDDVLHKQSIPLSEYINQLELIISNHKKS